MNGWHFGPYHFVSFLPGAEVGQNRVKSGSFEKKIVINFTTCRVSRDRVGRVRSVGHRVPWVGPINKSNFPKFRKLRKKL